MLLEKLGGPSNPLQGKSVLITGAGGGIGLEAAKALAYLGADLLIAEIDRGKGEAAQRELKGMFPRSRIDWYEADLSDEEQILALYERAVQDYGCVDVLFHNAAMIAMGNVEEVPVGTWDKSYRVNFRAPLRLTQLFLPEMRRRNSGTVVFVPSSGAAPYMGAYEVFKTAQVELCNTLAGELEGTDVHAFAVAPGLVKTETAMRGIEVVAEKMGMTTEEFYAMNGSHILSAEEAGCGFAVAVLHAERYAGQEIGSIQALFDSGLLSPPAADGSTTRVPAGERKDLLLQMTAVYKEQYAGWKERNVFERQWVLRDFKKTVGMSAEQFELDLLRLERELAESPTIDFSAYRGHFEKLKQYYQRQYKLLQGFEKNPEKLKEHSSVLLSWVKLLEEILEP